LSQTGSLILPFVYKNAAVGTTSQDILEGMAQGGHQVIVSNSRPHAVKRENLINYLGSHNAIFSDGITDLIVIYLEKEENRAAFVQAVDQEVKAQTTDYLAVLVADTDYAREEEQVRSKRSDEERSIEARDAGDYINSTYWPRGIWEGLLTTVLLLLILATGLCCTYELQTPTKWDDPKKLTAVHHG